MQEAKRPFLVHIFYVCSLLRAYLVKKPDAITTPFVARKKSSGKKDRGYDAEVGVVDSTRAVGTIFGFILTKLGP